MYYHNSMSLEQVSSLVTEYLYSIYSVATFDLILYNLKLNNESLKQSTRKSASPMYLGLVALGTVWYLGLAALVTF